MLEKKIWKSRGGGGRKERIALHIAGFKISGEGEGGRGGGEEGEDNRKVHPHMSLSGGLADITANGENTTRRPEFLRAAIYTICIIFPAFFFSLYPKTLFLESIGCRGRREGSEGSRDERGGRPSAQLLKLTT